MIYGASLELQNVNAPLAKSLNLAGFGESNLAAVGLRVVGGTSTWPGNIGLSSNRSAIHVDSSSTLIVGGNGGTGVVSNQGLNKLGSGTLQLAGTGANTFAGNGLVIWQGTVELNKSGANAIATTVTVGDSVGSAGAERLVLLQSNQIADANNATVSSTGRFDLGSNNDSINSFSVQAGLNASGSIVATTGTLTILANSSVDVLPNSNAGGSAGPVTISASIALQASAGAAATRTITVADTVAVEDLVITGIITDGDGNTNLQGLTKAGAGRMVLQAANQFSAHDRLGR